jgi:hypothetical protein
MTCMSSPTQSRTYPPGRQGRPLRHRPRRRCPPGRAHTTWRPNHWRSFLPRTERTTSPPRRPQTFPGSRRGRAVDPSGSPTRAGRAAPTWARYRAGRQLRVLRLLCTVVPAPHGAPPQRPEARRDRLTGVAVAIVALLVVVLVRDVEVVEARRLLLAAVAADVRVVVVARGAAVCRRTPTRAARDRRPPRRGTRSAEDRRVAAGQVHVSRRRVRIRLHLHVVGAAIQ